MRMEEYLELVYQWHRGRSIRQIRDSLQISRKTIRKYLLLFMASGLSREKPLPPQAELARIVASVVQVAVFEQPARERIRLYHRQIQDWLGQPHMTIQQVQRLLEEEHELKVSYMSVYRYVREHIEPLRKPVTVRLHAVAGEQAQVDFGYAGLMRDPETGKQRKAWAFIMILSYSRHRFVRGVAFGSESVPTSRGVGHFGVPLLLLNHGLQILSDASPTRPLCAVKCASMPAARAAAVKRR